MLACSFEGIEEIGSGCIDGEEGTGGGYEASGEDLRGCVAQGFGEPGEAAAESLRDGSDCVAAAKCWGC